MPKVNTSVVEVKTIVVVMDSLATKRLGYLLRWLRQRDGLSQKAMSKRIGCSQAQVDKLENGKTDKAGVLWIEQVCEEFEIPWGYFAEPGQAQLDPAAYMREHAGAGRLEAVAREVARVSAGLEELKAQKRDEPPSSTRKRTGR